MKNDLDSLIALLENYREKYGNLGIVINTGRCAYTLEEAKIGHDGEGNLFIDIKRGK